MPSKLYVGSLSLSLSVSPDRALCLPTFSHFVVVNKLLSLSLALALSLSRSLALSHASARARSLSHALTLSRSHSLTLLLLLTPPQHTRTHQQGEIEVVESSGRGCPGPHVARCVCVAPAVYVFRVFKLSVIIYHVYHISYIQV